MADNVENEIRQTSCDSSEGEEQTLINQIELFMTND